MKKIFKNPFFMFILGAIICGSVGVIATGLTAKEIEFESNENWNANTVEQALNDLYALKIPSNYSESERIVGKWIDNRPIYSKVLTLNVSNNTNYTFNAKNYLSADIDAIINAVGYSVVDSGKTIANFPCYYTSAAFLSEWMNYTDKTVHIISGSQYATATHYINFTYTKTTDQGTN